MLRLVQIGEVARTVGLATSAIRFYEERGLIPEPERTDSGYRDYSPEIVNRLEFIRAGQAVGLTLRELGQILEMSDRGESPCRHVTGLLDIRLREVDERIGDLKKLRAELIALRDDAVTVEPDDCSPDSICRIIGPA